MKGGLMQLSEAEWRVMNVVWDRSPATVRDVLDAVHADTGWAYSTVKTILARLTEKGALTVHKRTNTSLFAPTISRIDARGSAFRALLDRAFDGTFGSLVQHLMRDARLSASDQRALRELIDRESEREDES